MSVEVLETMDMLVKRLRRRREELGMSYQDLGDKTGLNKSTLQRYESGFIKDMPLSKLQIIADALNVDPDYMLGWSELREGKRTSIEIPVLGKVAAGVPIEAITDIVDYIEVPESLVNDGDYFALQILGNSMYPKLQEDDIIIVKQQQSVDNDEIAVVLVNGSDATVKKIVKHSGGVYLMPINPEYEPMFYTNEQIEELPVQIIGKVVESRRKF